MGLPNSEIAAAVANKVGNVSALSVAAAWVADKIKGFDVQDWVTILVGLAAIIAYGTQAYLNLAKARRLKKEVAKVGTK